MSQRALLETNLLCFVQSPSSRLNFIDDLLILLMASEAPWKVTFAKHAEREGRYPIDFCLATNDSGIPRARYLLHHGFLSLQIAGQCGDENLRDGDKPRVYSDCPTFATAAGSKKASHIYRSAGQDTQEQRSGGGGPVEAVWWFKSSKSQWRILGNCWLLAWHDVEDKASYGAFKETISRTLYSTGSDGFQLDELGWQDEIRGHYGRLPHHMTKSVALEDTRLGVIVPSEVELMELSDPMESKKWSWKASGTEQVEWVLVKSPNVVNGSSK